MGEIARINAHSEPLLSRARRPRDEAPITHVTIDYVARSGRGVAIQTFGTPEIAAAWVEAEGAKFPGFHVECVRVTERREIIFRDQTQERAA